MATAARAREGEAFPGRHRYVHRHKHHQSSKQSKSPHRHGKGHDNSCHESRQYVNTTPPPPRKKNNHLLLRRRKTTTTTTQTHEDRDPNRRPHETKLPRTRVRASFARRFLRQSVATSRLPRCPSLSWLFGTGTRRAACYNNATLAFFARAHPSLSPPPPSTRG